MLAIFVFFAASAPTAFAANFAQTDIKRFWSKFKTAVAKNDRNALAALTRFPLSMPYGVKSVRTKAEFLRRYASIFDGETDARRCFARAELIRETARRYAVYCGFKPTPDDEENKPIKYYFELTRAGWRFAGLDNINE